MQKGSETMWFFIVVEYWNKPLSFWVTSNFSATERNTAKFRHEALISIGISMKLLFLIGCDVAFLALACRVRSEHQSTFCRLRPTEKKDWHNLDLWQVDKKWKLDLLQLYYRLTPPVCCSWRISSCPEDVFGPTSQLLWSTQVHWLQCAITGIHIWYS